MATTYTLTGSLSDAGVPFAGGRAQAWIVLANAKYLIDDASEMILGRWPVDYDATTGEFSVELPSTASGAGYSPDGGFAYRFYVDYRDSVPNKTVQGKVRSDAFELTADRTLKQALGDAIELTSVSTAEWVDFQAKYDEMAAIVATTDGLVAAAVEDDGSLTKAALSATIAQVSAWARNPDLLISGAVTRDTNGAATSAPVTWPDGSPGTYTADALSTAFPGAVDGYHITYGSPVTLTFTQPTITRDATGAATNVPEMVVS